MDGLEALSKRMERDEADIASCNEKLSDHEDRLQETTSKVEEFVTALSGLSNDLQAQVGEQQQRAEEEAEERNKEKNKQQSVQEMLSNMVTKIEKSAVDVGIAFKSLQDKEDKIQGLTSKVEENATITARHDDDLTRIDQTVKDVEAELQREGERITSAETKAGALKTKTELAEQSLRNVVASQREANQKIEVQARDLGMAQQRLQTSERRLDEIGTRLHAVNKEVTSTSEEVSNMSGRVDIAHDYLHGLGKGFQNAHSKIVDGQEGMLPYKASPSSTLPALPETHKKNAERPLSARR